LAAVTPSGIPDEIKAPITPLSFNLLVGEFEPAPVRKARTRRRQLAFTTVALCLSLFSIGAIRRSHHARAAGGDAGRQAELLLAAFSPDHHEETLAARAKVSQQASDAAKQTKVAPDAALLLESLLKKWPGTTKCAPQSVAVTPDGVSIGVLVEGDAAPFVKSLVPPAGMTLDEPRVTSLGPTTRINLHLRSTEDQAR